MVTGKNKNMEVKCMKKIIAGLIVAVLVVAWNVPVFADSSSTTVQVVITVPTQLDLIVTLFDVPPGPTVTTNGVTTTQENDNPFGTGAIIGSTGAPGTMDFGTLTTDPLYGIWTSAKHYCFAVSALTSGRPYIVQQTCYGIMNGANNLNTALTMTPVYAPEDQYQYTTHPENGILPPGASAGNPTLAFGVNQKVYDSGSTGASRTVQCHYGVYTADPAHPVTGAAVLTSSQPAGTYTGKIIFTLSLK